MTEHQPEQPTPEVPADQPEEQAIPLPVTDRAPERQPPNPASRSRSTQGSLQQVWQQIQPVLTTGSIRILKLTIALLQKAVEQLEKPPKPQSKPPVPQPRTVTSSSATTVEPAWDDVIVSEEEGADAIRPSMPALEETQRSSEIPSPSVVPRSVTAPQDSASLPETIVNAGKTALAQVRPVLEKVRPTIETAWQKARPAIETVIEKARPALKRLEPSWQAFLSKVRSVLPETISTKLSDRALSGAIAGVLIFLLWTTSSLFSSKPAKVAKAPAVRPAPPVAIAPAPTTVPPELVTPVEPIAPPEVIAPIEPTPPPKLVAPEPEEPIAINPPVIEEPIVVSPPVVAEPPPMELTPEQRLIAAIQDQVAEVTDRYSNGLIQSVQANFRSSRLVVNVTDRWYELPESQQNQLADDMLKRSHELDFKKLELTDKNETLLARSPVVGDNMVILKRI